MRTRLALVLVGIAIAAYGGVLLLQQGWDNLMSTVLWLAGGVIAHDGLLAPATIVVCALGIKALPSQWRAAAAGGLLVLGTVTISAIPVLGRFGAREDNETLLDRSYGWGWLLFAGLVLVGVVFSGLRSSTAPSTGDEMLEG